MVDSEDLPLFVRKSENKDGKQLSDTEHCGNLFELE